MNFESRRMQVDRIAYESYASNSAAHRLCTKITQENLHNPVYHYLGVYHPVQLGTDIMDWCIHERF